MFNASMHKSDCAPKESMLELGTVPKNYNWKVGDSASLELDSLNDETFEAKDHPLKP